MKRISWDNEGSLKEVEKEKRDCIRSIEKKGVRRERGKGEGREETRENRGGIEGILREKETGYDKNGSKNDEMREPEEETGEVKKGMK